MRHFYFVTYRHEDATIFNHYLLKSDESLTEADILYDCSARNKVLVSYREVGKNANQGDLFE